MGTGVDNRHFTGLPIGDIDEHLDSTTDVKNLLGLAEIQYALSTGYRGRGSGDGDLPARPARNFRQGRADIASKAARAGGRELGEENKHQEASEHDPAEDE